MELGEALELRDGGRLLDVACGQGTSLRALVETFPIDGVGLEPSPPSAEDTPRLRFARGLAQDIPSAADSFDAVLCECALSTFPDQGAALREMRRVLRPGGRVALSDMVVNGAVPAALAEWVHLGTCLSHARSLADYRALLEAAGFEVLAVNDVGTVLAKLLRDLKRRLLEAALARAAGTLPRGVELDVPRGRAALRAAQEAIAAGVVSYGYLIARKPAGA